MDNTQDVVTEFISSRISKQKQSSLEGLKKCISSLSKGNATKIAIFGAGEAGRKFYSQLQKRLIQVDFFCDNDVNKQGYVFQNCYCVSIKELEIVKNKTLVIIVSPNFSQEIEKQLLEYQFPYIIKSSHMEPTISAIEPVWGIEKIDSLKEVKYSSEEVRLLIEEFQLTLYETCRYYEELIESIKGKQGV